jgi:hypothetical protein
MKPVINMSLPDFGLIIDYNGSSVTINPSSLHYTHPGKRDDLVFFVDEATGCICEFLIRHGDVCDPTDPSIYYGVVTPPFLTKT